MTSQRPYLYLRGPFRDGPLICTIGIHHEEAKAVRRADELAFEIKELRGSLPAQLAPAHQQPGRRFSGWVMLVQATRQELARQGLQVSLGDQLISVPVTQSDQVAVTQFVAVAVAARYTSEATLFGAQLVSLGATPVQTLQLMAALQGLANQATLTSLASGITAFNTIVDTAPAPALVALAENPVFAAANITLRAARSALSE